VVFENRQDIAAPKRSMSKQFRENALRVLIVLVVLSAAYLVFADKSSEIHFDRVVEAMIATSSWSLGLAVVLTAVSFLAMAGNDVVAARYLRKKVSTARALLAGFTAVSVSQVSGFGLVVGSAVRWRMYKGTVLGAIDSGVITGLVAAAFFAALLGLIAFGLLVEPILLSSAIGTSEWFVTFSAVVCLLLLAGMGVLSYFQISLDIAGRRLALPTFPIFIRFFALGCVDALAAAVVFWILLPPEAAISLWAVIPVYLAALGIGMISNAPAGLGAFEAVCLTCFPQIDGSELVASLILYRGVYYGLPFCLGVTFLGLRELGFMVPKPHKKPVVRLHTLRSPVGQISPQAVRALGSSSNVEAELAFLGDKELLHAEDGSAFLMVAEKGGTFVAMGDPVGDRRVWPELVARFTRTAKRRSLRPALYKVSPEFADVCSQSGFSVSKCGENAVLDPKAFTLDGKDRRELRRKCQKALKAGIKVTIFDPGACDLAKLEPIAEEWALSHGGEKGFSMGWFHPELLCRHKVLVAELAGEPVAFLSIWTSPNGAHQAIDVMRQKDVVPDGTMHALVADAVRDAGEIGVQSFSLCAVALKGLEQDTSLAGRIANWIYQTQSKRHGLPGLARFKQIFRPEWTPIYVATKSRFLPVAEVWDIQRLIHQTPAQRSSQHASCDIRDQNSPLFPQDLEPQQLPDPILARS
jgi:phosphatidylglycerol lysyltransferase